MKKIILPLLLILFINISATAQTIYAAAKEGISVRKKPTAKAKVLGTIPYGQKIDAIELTQEDVENQHSTEGAAGYWRKIKFNNTIGYITEEYVLPVPPPKNGINSFKAYFNQLSTVAGKSKVKQPGTTKLIGNSGEEFSKELYKNGMEIQEYTAHEFSSALYLLPQFTPQQAYLLVQLLQTYPELVTEKEAFPTENFTEKTDRGTKTVTITKTRLDEEGGIINKITIELDDAPYITFEIFWLNGQVAISWSESV